ncbi:AAA family ATPase [Vibrio scophthalmi]|uniref:AAA family ATPase n=1 Tax=Vibrio scophthalmi TaxID=45658 RepID=UPI003AAC6AF6
MAFQIRKVTIDGKEYELSKDSTSGHNLISVMTGKNGAGKSRILEFLASNFYVSDNFLIENPANWNEEFNAVTSDYSQNQVLYLSGGRECAMQRMSPQVASVFKLTTHADDRYDLFPRRMICLSTSPFDRFPLNVSKSLSTESIYSYIGMKNSKRSSSIVSLISNVLDSMFRNPEKIESNFAVIKRTLEYLGYGNRILVSYRSNVKFNFNELSRNNISKLLTTFDNPIFNDVPIGGIEWDSGVNSIYNSVKFLVESNENKWKSSFSIPINLSKSNVLEDEYIKAIQMLSKSGIFSVKSLKLSQAADNRKFVDFVDASSGEQCLAMMLLGIASQIENNSLICIDEPEISLHPEWQEEFIPLLNDLFSSYIGCHFIIATHSPLLVSKLTRNNCYILDLDDNNLIEYSQSGSYSSDYQLATLFKSPGFKNEYLVNESLDILSALSKAEPIAVDLVERIKLVSSLKPKISPEDPVYSLITTIERVMETINED